MYMLDTNAVIMGVRHPDWPIFEKIKAHVGKDLCISVITLGELEVTRLGVYAFLSGIKIIDFDAEAAGHFGDIFAALELKRMRISDRDTMIAAHARSLGYTLVTNNTREFSRVDGLKIEDWK